METTKGFYKLDGGLLLYGPEYVLNSKYELRIEDYNQYTYPIDGWYWFENEEDAHISFGLPYEPPIDSDEIPQLL